MSDSCERRHGEARGRFLPGDAAFMPLGHSLEIPPLQSRTRLADGPVESTSTVDPSLLRDGSGAQAWFTPENGGFAIRQAGPRQLWAEVERAHEFWGQRGSARPRAVRHHRLMP